MGVDVINGPVDIPQGQLDTPLRPFTRRCDHFIAIRRGAVTDHLTIDMRSPFSRMLQFFHNNDARAVGDDKAVPVDIIGP